MKFNSFQYLSNSSIVICYLFAGTTNAQVIPDNTLPQNTRVTQQDNNILINGGTRAGNNLFHSFEQFSVSADRTAIFDHALDIKNILSRVTGNSISDIQGIIKTHGAANLFLVNPNGITFGNNASLQVGGSFIGTTADSILFPDGEFSATDLDSPPLITINAPIGLSFRDNPGEITNLAVDEDLIGLRVSENQTIGLIGGDIFIEGGFVSTPGGRIELGSVGENSIVKLTEVEKGWDFSYEGVENFRDINLSFAAFVETIGTDTGDIELQGRNISLTEGSQIAINTEVGKAGNLTVMATESLSLDGNGIEVDIQLGDLPTAIFSDIKDRATGEGSQIRLETPKLAITNGARIYTTNLGTDPNSQGGNITINTNTLTLNKGGLIASDTFGAGNAGNLTVNASESIELTGTVPGSNDPSALFANVEKDKAATGNGGDLTITTPRLVILDGAQVATTAQNSGNGGNLTINASEVFISGTSPTAEFRGEGRSGIFVSAEPLLRDMDTGEPTLDEAGNPFITTGNGGTLNLTADELIVEKGAIISADNFGRGESGNANIDVNNLIVRNGGQISAGSLLGVEPIDKQRGAGGTLNINANDSVEVTGTGDINGTPVKSSLLTLAEGTGDAGDLNITTDKFTVADGGEINASATGTGAAGNLSIKANSLDLNEGTLTADTAAGTGGNIKLEIEDNITLRNNSSISAKATGTADGGNIDIINPKFIVAYPDGNNDILASAEEGLGGRITITDADGIFGIRERPQSNRTNDINATGGVDDGKIIITNPDVDVTKGLVQTPQNVVEPEQTVAQACRNDLISSLEEGGTIKPSGLTIKGKGGIPPLPTEPFNADAILVDGSISNPNPQSQHPEIKPIKTSIGDIYPARGVIVKENGDVILTAYPTDGIDRRTPDIKANCSTE